MSTRLASLVLAASTVVSSYIVLLIGCVLPKLFATIFGIHSATDLDILIPPITKFAARHAWAFASAAALICLVVIFLIRRSPAQVLQIVAVGLSAQALVVWLAMFCYCYNGLTGSMSFHHSSQFEFAQFFQFAFGVFPVTLCAIVAPALAALLSQPESTKRLGNLG